MFFILIMPFIITLSIIKTYDRILRIPYAHVIEVNLSGKRELTLETFAAIKGIPMITFTGVCYYK